MWIKLFSVMALLSLAGCYSQAPKSVIVVEKSSHLENITPQHLDKPSKIKKKIKKITSSWAMPINSKVSKPYSKQHPGITFRSHQGQKIHAIRDGKIIYIGDKIKSFGQMIIIRHPFGFNSTYTQIQSSKVAVGDSVDKGQVIARTSKRAFYLEMRKFEQTINPLKYLK